ncbi:MAG: hypothetical protein J6S14_15685 [Clostridia bacterium]|nr:hypothetical protein [Clostridia bacterium]
MNAKDKAAVLAIALFLAVAAGVAAVTTTKPKNIYPETAIVIATEESYGWLSLMTANGNVFAYETDVEDWQTGDICSLIMDSKGTETVKDDELIKIRYSGRIENYTYRPSDRNWVVN